MKEGRPTAETPVFTYLAFAREHFPSDQKLKAMFEDDVALRTAFRDKQTEKELLGLFYDW